MEIPSSMQTTAILPSRSRRDRRPQPPKPRPTTDAMPEPQPRHGPVEVRTDGGWTLRIPAPAAIVGAASLLLLGLFGMMDPVRIHEAWVERQADQVQRWQSGEERRLQRSLDAVEGPLREMRRQALIEGLAPDGDLAPSPCEGTVQDHLAAHLAEAAKLAAALSSHAGAPNSAVSALPFRSPIDLTGGDYALYESQWIPDSIHVSSRKGGRNDPFTGEWKEHKGMDIAAPIGTAVIAPGDGTILFAGSYDPNVDHAKSLLGNYIEIKHGATGYTTIYGHLSRIDVKTGQAVHAGDRIGAVGTTGHSTAPHLHYQVMKGGESVNPLRFITDVILVKDGKSLLYAKQPIARAEEPK